MPATRSERERMQKHTYSEDHDLKKDPVYASYKELGTDEIFDGVWKKAFADKEVLWASVPEAIFITALLYLFISANIGIFYTAVAALMFIVLEMLIGVLPGRNKIMLGGLKGEMPWGSSMLITGMSFQPITYLLLANLLLAFRLFVAVGGGTAGYLVSSVIYACIAGAVTLRFGVAPMFYSDGAKSRSAALNDSWHIMSANFGSVFSAVLSVALIPIFIAAVYAVTGIWEVLIFEFIAIAVVMPLWQAASANIYASGKKTRNVAYKIS
jgi:hypothetical protein